MKFVVYKVTYSGNNLSAKYYIGSTQKSKIDKGYRGSICSKKWHSKYYDELEKHPNLFNVEILSEWNNRKDAINEELRLHKFYDVVKSDLFFNESLACPNGFFGRDVSGENNPAYGREWSNERRAAFSKLKKGKKWTKKQRESQSKVKRKGKDNPWYGQKHTDETKEKMSNPRINKEGCKNNGKGNTNRKGAKLTEETKEKLRKANIGKKHSAETKEKMRLAQQKRREQEKQK